MPTPTIDTVLSNNGFWPDVAVRPLVDSYRVPSDARDGLLVETLTHSMLETNKALREAQKQAVANGYAALDAYAAAHPDDVIAGQPVAHTLYFGAVYHLAKAKSVKRLQTVARRPVPETETLASDSTEQYFLDQHQTCLAGLLELMADTGTQQTEFGVYVSSVGVKAQQAAASTPSPQYQPLSANLTKLAALTALANIGAAGASSLAGLAALAGEGYAALASGAWALNSGTASNVDGGTFN